MTTATEDLTDQQLDSFPLSGRLFTIRPGFHGVTPNLWSGSGGPP
jgi:hypothetical protein